VCDRRPPRQATGPSRLLELDMGPKFAGVCSNGLENIDCLEVAGVRDFFLFFLFWGEARIIITKKNA
jgi:hypothetical protein